MLNLIIPAVILVTSHAASTDIAEEPAASQQLSSAEFSALLGTRDGLPSNCQILGDPCFVIRCDAPTQPGDWPSGLYDCSALD